MRLCWLLPGFLGAFLLSSTAEAAKLESWRFDVSQNRLNFITDEGVQPRAQLIVNPTRLVIDLPGITLGQPAIQQSLGRTIRSMRVGQFNPQTTRLVIELAAGYTLDPRQVKVNGESPTRWSVQLPNPQLLTLAAPARAGTGQPVSRAPAVAVASTQIDNVRVTPNGFFIRTRGDTPEVEILREREDRSSAGGDRRQVNIDLKGAALSYRLANATFSINRLGVSRLRATQIQTSPPVARVTLDVDGSSQDWQASASNLGGVVVIPQRRATSASDPKNWESFSLLPDQSQALIPPSSSQPKPVAAPQPVLVPVPPPQISRLPPAAVPPQPSLQANRHPVRRTVVVVDIGHGGKDAGAIGIGGLQEKNVILPIGLEVARILEQQGVQVVLPRADDRFIDLAPRVALAQGVKAEVFVSIHANAINLSRPDINGIETYYYSGGGGRLAQIIHANILQSLGVRDRGVRRARFYVLRRTSMPSTLVEVGFVTGAEDAPRLADPNFQRQMAAAIARGILQYLKI